MTAQSKTPGFPGASQCHGVEDRSPDSRSTPSITRPRRESNPRPQPARARCGSTAGSASGDDSAHTTAASRFTRVTDPRTLDVIAAAEAGPAQRGRWHWTDIPALALGVTDWLCRTTITAILLMGAVMVALVAATRHGSPLLIAAAGVAALAVPYAVLVRTERDDHPDPHQEA